METYTAEDGLRILEYLDIKPLDGGEELIFKNIWDEAYKHQEEPVSTVRLLYADRIPFICNTERDVAMAVSHEREIEFDVRFRESELKKIVDSGASLKDYLRFRDKTRYIGA